MIPNVLIYYIFEFYIGVVNLDRFLTGINVLILKLYKHLSI